MRYIPLLSLALLVVIQFMPGSAEAARASKLPKCDQFIASPLSITSGDNVTLSWNTTYAKTVSIDNGVGFVALDGSLVVKPTEDITYTLTATDSAGTSVTCSQSITVVIPTPTCPLYTASPTSILTGGSSVLTWDTVNATGVTLNGVAVAIDGTVTVVPTTTTEYLLTMQGPGGSSTCSQTVQVLASTSPDFSFCAATLETGSGTLCAIAPSNIDSRTFDVSQPTSYPAGDEIYGFGYHVVAFPYATTTTKGIWLHLTGSYGRPYNQSLSKFGNPLWLNELMQQGYTVIQLAYDNRFSVNADLCGQTSPGYDRDNCAGEVREIALTGLGESPFRSTDEFNTIDYRLSSLLAYLQTSQSINLPETLDPANIDWSQLDLSGHSQGANQAYYIAKKRLVASVCIMAGGYDLADSVNPGSLNIADWFTEGVSQTPIPKIHAFLTKSDAYFSLFRFGLIQAVGLPIKQIIVDANDPYYDENGVMIEGHGATMKSPQLAAARAQACF